MRRREFIALLGSGLVWPFPAQAQQTQIPVIGYLSSGTREGSAYRVQAFRQGLSESGYIEGQNTTIQYHWAEDHNEHLPALADDLVRRKVTVIVTGYNIPAAQAAKSATKSIPIVFSVGADPVEAGLVTSLNRPEGNLTGATSLAFELLPKRLQLLHELVPSRVAIALLVNPTNSASEKLTKDARAAAATLGLDIYVLQASTKEDFDTVFAKLVQMRAGGLVIASDAFFSSYVEQLGALTLRHAIPAIYQSYGFAATGGLISYGSSITNASHQAGIYVGRILKGTKPGDLPVVQAEKTELFINNKTAKALGLTIPPTLLSTADKVIE